MGEGTGVGLLWSWVVVSFIILLMVVWWHGMAWHE